jgi:hypothetical protein
MGGGVGDRIVVTGRRVGEPAHSGEIVEVLGPSRYLVRWNDGRETVLVPGSDATIERSTGSDTGRSVEELSLTVRLRIREDHDRCQVDATVETASGVFSGQGEARRHPLDPEVPLIGEELAVARALARLATGLEEAAREAIARHEDRDLHLVP